MCRVYLHQASMGKSSQKIGKTHNYPSFGKVTRLVARTLVAIKTKEKISKSKTITLTFLYNLKEKQQYQGSKNWCYTESFMLLTISNLRTTAFCFGNIEFLK